METMTPAGSRNAFPNDDLTYRELVHKSPDALYVLQDSKVVLVNEAGRRQLRASKTDLVMGMQWSTLLHPDFHEQSAQRVAFMLETNTAAPLTEQKYLCLDGSVIDVEVQSVPFSYVGRAAIQVIARDITHRKAADEVLRVEREKFRQLAAEANKAKELLEAENRILEMMSCESDVGTIYTEICRWVESVLSTPSRTSVVLLENDGIRLRTGAAPSLSPLFSDFMLTIPVGPQAGSCGTAMFFGHQIVVEDIATDALWQQCRGPALEHGLRACWSIPVLSPSGMAIGALNVFYDRPCAPEAGDVEFVATVTHLIGVIVRKELVERSLQESEDRYRSVVTSLTEGIVVQARTGVILACNPSAERILRVEPGTLTRMSRDDYCNRLFFNDGSTIPRDEWPARVTFRTGKPQLNLTVGLEMLDGTVVWLQQNILPIQRAGERDFDTVLISFTDVTEVKAAQQRLQFMATHDALTGLHNRAALTEKLGHAITLAERMKYRVAVLFLDLDRFKHVNDTAGHESGDSVLREVAERLQDCVRKTDTLARLGGDEFVIMAEGFNDTAYLNVLCERVLKAMSEPFRVDEQDHYLGVSIGIGVYPDNGNDWPGLLRCADSAMYHAKDSGRNNFKFYTAQLNENTQRRYSLEKNLRHALLKDEFLVHYQPKISLQTGKIVGAEALLRWRSDVLGMVAPSEFVPVAEDIGFIVELGKWILEKACRTVVIWRQLRDPSLRIAVNLSARQFHDENLVGSVKDILARTGLPGDALEFEITESLLMGGIDDLMPTFNALIECGITFSLDDFGTGYSSLSYLQRFPISNIKIDRSFISGIPRNRDSVALTQAIVAMAQSLNMTVTAEGVEDSAQEDFLRQAQCEEMQGFLFSKPVSDSEFDAMLTLGPPLQ